MSRRKKPRPLKPQPQRAKKKRSPKQRNTAARQIESMFNWLISDDRIFAGLKLHGNTKWNPASLIRLAILWAWDDSRYVTDSFESAEHQCCAIGNSAIPESYQGMMRALVKWTSMLRAILWLAIQRKIERFPSTSREIHGWAPIAFDGSRSTAPRTQSNETAFCSKTYGKSAKARARRKRRDPGKAQRVSQSPPQPQEPQVWITLMWHMALRLPWTWRLGPSHSSERAHVQEMLRDEDFPENTMFCGDAGFVGYPLWSEILGQGYQFLVRVGANVRLLTESADFRLKEGGRVICWPEADMKAGKPPLTLRLVRIKLGKTQMWMLTSVVRESKLSKAAIIKLYKKRWGIEVEFRGLKQTLDRAKLRCRDAHRLLVELDWALMGQTMAILQALRAQLDPEGASSPDAQLRLTEKRSLASVMREIRRTLKQLTPKEKTLPSLTSRLRQAVTDDYERSSSKKARYRPPNKDKKPLGEPKVRQLSKKQRLKLEQQNHNVNTV